ncbi:MAG TPA: SsrA-binding protein SmpB [Patescibacteria group bacterium]
MKTNSKAKPVRLFNKRAKFNYELGKKYEAGIVLSGGEAKSVRTGHCDLSRSYVKIMNNEAYLINANIPVAGALNYDSTRTRKLLLHRSEISDIETNLKQKKLTIVPISVYTKGRLIKAEIALGKPKKTFEKKASIKQKDIKRDIEREARVKE